jgi:hypothetical protein
MPQTKVRRATQDVIWATRGQYHVLTYAEEGFAPLNIHARGTGLANEELRLFADAVNQRAEVGSLYPKAQLSALPRSAIRTNQSAKVLQGFIEEFLRANASTLHATKLLLDFRTPAVPPFVNAAVEAALQCPEAHTVEELVVVE